MTLEMFQSAGGKIYDHRKWLEGIKRLCRKCKKQGMRRSMQIANIDEAMIEMKEPKNGFKYEYWPYFKCKSCRLYEAL